MSHTYAIATDGTSITLTLTRGAHFLAEVSARPEVGAHDLIKTARAWRDQFAATPEIVGTQDHWDALPLMYWQILDELLVPTLAAA